MRLRRLALVALVVLAGCGGGDDDGTDGSGDGALTAAEAQRVLEDALLDADDLGAGWSLEETTAPDEDDEDDEDFETCMGRPSPEANDLAESEERVFTRETESPVPPRLTVGAGATGDAARFADFHDIVLGEQFATCLVEQIERELAASGDAEVEVGSADRADGFVEVDGVRSSGLTVPMTISAQGFTFEIEAAFVVVSAGQLGGGLSTIAQRGDIATDDLRRWATLLAEGLTA